MMARLHHWQQQFDSRALRERVLMIAAVAALGAMLGDALWLTPAAQRFAAVRAQQHTVLGAHEALRGDLAQLAARYRAQGLQARQDMAAMRQRTRDGEEALRRYEDTLVGPDHMIELLDRLLAERGQLRVRDMRTLPREDLLAPAPAAGAASGAAAEASAATRSAATAPRNGNTAAQAAGITPGGEPSLYRHGVDLTLEGSYGELLEYLKAVEALPQRVLWGGLQLKVEQYPVCVLTVRLYTLSRDRHWLEI